MPNEWVPSRRDFVVELLALIAVPTATAIWNVIDKQPVNTIILMTLGVLVLILATVFFWEGIAGPRRKLFASDRDLMNGIDGWLRDNGFFRGPIQWQGYAHALAVTVGESTIWVGKRADRDEITVMSARGQASNETPIFQRMTDAERLSFRFDLASELARAGAFYQTTDNPLVITFWDSFPVGRNLTEERFMEHLHHIGRIGSLIQNYAAKNLGLITIRTTAQPPSVNTDVARVEPASEPNA